MPARLRDRALLLTIIRKFFLAKEVLEVNTPCLGKHSVSAPYIESLSLVRDKQAYYLQTSPEYAMKRLLAEGAGAIYQICPAFRGGESGSRHNPEFTMLEWYRPGFSLAELMAELAELLQMLAEVFDIEFKAPSTVSYRKLFENRFNINPHKLEFESIFTSFKNEWPDYLEHIDGDNNLDDILDALFAQGIESGLQSPHFVIDYPASQAALAKLGKVNGDQVARRFELFWQGMELANGYDELNDPDELRLRSRRDNEIRKLKQLPEMPIDERLLKALPKMPECAGLALGLDRLQMLLTGKASIDEVISFTIDNS